ncbi:related to Splicing factor U2AF-associated protein 2 [Ustilago trichophora]|uniref:Related to Splicing factor U2AF-associated protein 2 n=1 Tax=Ustilago trichophora TaxID=86804 RepID=A0A5C3DSM4_9BASI|nr:related to Splicing factor U2AF-associated protein 2 [Ustilago trichophora]
MHPSAPTAAGSEDPRVYLDRLSGNWRYEDDEGEEWEWQPFLQHSRAVDLGETEEESVPSASSSRASSSLAATQPNGHWVKVLDDDLIRAQQAAYSVEGVDESQPAQAVLRRGKKRSASPIARPPTSSSSSSKVDKLPPSKKTKPITSLYVTGLPLDATSEEIARVFSRYGVLLEDDSGHPRVKLYYDDKTGMFKGEALVVYFKPESVELAISMLDETNMRGAIGQSAGSAGGPVMRVQRAEFPATAKGDGPGRGESSSTGGKNSGSGAPNPKGDTESSGQRRNLTDTDRKKIAKRVARLETKLSDWRDESDSEPETEPTTNSAQPILNSTTGARTVVLTKMFTLYELDSDPTLLLDLKEDVREECSEKIGGVTNVVLWDKEPEGIITVKFKTAEQAKGCVKMMKGRFFAQRRIDAFVLAGKPRFKRSGKGGDDAADDSDDAQEEEAEEKRRKDAFGSWLEDA